MTTDKLKLDDKCSAVMTDITTAVIKAIESGVAPWQKPWANRAGAEQPTNLATKAEYRGLNSLYLSMLGGAFGCDFWIGYGQAKKLKGHVRKGEKSTAILAPMIRKGEDKKTGEAYQYVSGFRVVRIFNATQCDGLTIPTAETFEPRTIDAGALDQFAINTGADIRHGGDRAYFDFVNDYIQLPEQDQFNTAGGYYGTKLHELTHWTGHKSRLDRFNKKTGRTSYAFEELVAELGAYYLSERIGCPNESVNHASYLDNWLKAMKGDIKYLWQAASKAEKAAGYLLELQNKKDAEAA